MAQPGLWDVQLRWSSGLEMTITTRATTSKKARAKAREFALNRTGVPPDSVRVKRLHVL